MIIEESNCFLLIVDVQKKLLKNIYNKDRLVNNIKKVVEVFDILNLPIVTTEQYPKGLGETDDSITNNTKRFSKIEKTSFSCFQNKDFCKILENLKKSQIIICGLETHICVYQTSYELSKNSYEVFVLKDCVSSRNNDNHIDGLNRMRSENIGIVNTEMLIFDILKDSKHSKFKELSKLIK